jgi:hypothetical protein
MTTLQLAMALVSLTGGEKTKALSLVSKGIRNLSHATKVYLEMTEGGYATDSLQSWLRTVDPGCSGKAAGNRTVMQRYPDKYGVRPEDRFTGTLVNARSGGSRRITVNSANEADISAWLKE